MIVKFEDVSLEVREDSTHEWLLETSLVARCYGVSDSAILNHKKRKHDELIEGKHWVSQFVTTLGGRQEMTFWTKKGIVRLGFFVKSDKAKKFRDFAEDLIIKATEPSKPKPTREEKYLKQGKDAKWIEQRVESVGTRKFFTATLKQHGVKNEGYRNCTNAIYIPLYGGTTAVVREKKGIDKNKSIRDNISRSEVAAINLVEQLASERIENEDAFGNAQCEVICSKASKAVANAIIQARK